ncbi:hypothetical protein U1Q18_002393 [Sarracenia purpurea var. burkii]
MVQTERGCRKSALVVAMLVSLGRDDRGLKTEEGAPENAGGQRRHCRRRRLIWTSFCAMVWKPSLVRNRRRRWTWRGRCLRRQGVEDGGRCAGKRRWAATSLPASEVDMDKLLCYGLEALSGSKQKKEMDMAWEMFGLPKNIGFVCLFEDKVGGGANDDLL